MNYRKTTLLAQTDINSAGTYVIDLTLSDVISNIAITFRATNTNVVPTAHPANIISKIELVDGSDVLWSLSGKEAMAKEFYNARKTPQCINMYLNTVMCIATFNMMFGRFLYDPALALDPKKFRNPQLKITHNLAAGGAAPDACNLVVIADVFDEKEVTPTGFLMSKEIVSYSLSTSANEYIDLPTDYVMRNLLVMSMVDGKMPYELYNTLKLSENNDKRVPIDSSVSRLLESLASQWPKIQENIEGAALTTTKDFYTMATHEKEFAGISMGFTGAYMTSDYSYGGNIDIRASAGCNFKAIVRGYAPFGALIVPFGRQDDYTDWYDVTKLGNLRLTLKAGSSLGSDSPTCEVVSEQLRLYGGAAAG